MNKLQLDNYKYSINQAKEIVGGSINLSHGLEHTRNVETHAVEIFKELKKTGKTKNTTIEMVRLAVWWHDVFKTKYLQLDPRSIPNEDVKSAEIFIKHNTSLFPKDIVNKIAYAICVHSHKVEYFLTIKNSYTPLAQILIEADCIDALNLKRTQIAYKNYPKWIYFLGQKLYAKSLYKRLQLLPQTKYASKMYRLKMKAYK